MLRRRKTHTDEFNRVSKVLWLWRRAKAGDPNAEVPGLSYQGPKTHDVVALAKVAHAKKTGRLDRPVKA
jgi:hypothetical protein